MKTESINKRENYPWSRREIKGFKIREKGNELYRAGGREEMIKRFKCKIDDSPTRWKVE